MVPPETERPKPPPEAVYEVLDAFRAEDPTGKTTAIYFVPDQFGPQTNAIQERLREAGINFPPEQVRSVAEEFLQWTQRQENINRFRNLRDIAEPALAYVTGVSEPTAMLRPPSPLIILPAEGGLPVALSGTPQSEYYRPISNSTVAASVSEYAQTPYIEDKSAIRLGLEQTLSQALGLSGDSSFEAAQRERDENARLRQTYIDPRSLFDQLLQFQPHLVERVINAIPDDDPQIPLAKVQEAFLQLKEKCKMYTARIGKGYSEERKRISDEYYQARDALANMLLRRAKVASTLGEQYQRSLQHEEQTRMFYALAGRRGLTEGELITGLQSKNHAELQYYQQKNKDLATWNAFLSSVAERAGLHPVYDPTNAFGSPVVLQEKPTPATVLTEQPLTNDARVKVVELAQTNPQALTRVVQAWQQEPAKAALLFVTLGPERSRPILEELPDEEVKRITVEIFKLGEITEDLQNATFAEAYQLYEHQQKETARQTITPRQP